MNLHSKSIKIKNTVSNFPLIFFNIRIFLLNRTLWTECQAKFNYINTMFHKIWQVCNLTSVRPLDVCGVEK